MSFLVEAFFVFLCGGVGLLFGFFVTGTALFGDQQGITAARNPVGAILVLAISLGPPIFFLVYGMTVGLLAGLSVSILRRILVQRGPGGYLFYLRILAATTLAALLIHVHSFISF